MKPNLLLFLLPAFLFFTSCEKEKEEDLYGNRPNAFLPTGWSVHDAELPAAKLIILDNSENIWFCDDTHLKKRSGDANIDYSAPINAYFSGNSGSKLTALAVDNDNNIWLGATHTNSNPDFAGLMMFDGTNYTAYTLNNSGLHDDHIVSIAVDAMNVKWILTTNSVVRFDGINWSYYDATNSDFRQYKYVVCTPGHVWVGGPGQITGFDGTNYTTFNSSNSSFPAWVRNIDTDNTGNIWFLQSNTTICKFDGTIFTSFTIPPEYDHSASTPSIGLIEITTDPSGNIWLGGYGELLRFNGTSWSAFNVPNYSMGGRNYYALISSMVIKSDGSRWILAPPFKMGNSDTKILLESKP